MSNGFLYLRTCEFCEEEFSQHVDHRNSDEPTDAICGECYEAELYEHNSGSCGGDCIVCDEIRREKAT